MSRTLVAELLNRAGLQPTSQPKDQGGRPPDRDAQFAHINTQVATALAEQQPVISVDAEKKEIVGISVTMAASIVREAIPKKSGSMTF